MKKLVEVVQAAVVVLVMAAIIFGFMMAADHVKHRPAPVDHHVEWQPYPAGGLLLVNPMRNDSLAVLLIPPGSLLMIPHAVTDSLPDQRTVTQP
jgi:hypothetical protein